MTPLLAAAAAVALLMLATWAVSVRRADVSIVDVVWGLAFALVAWCAAATGDGDAGRRLLLGVLTTIWGVRLATHIAARRRREPGEDRRYARLRARDPARFARRSLLTIFGVQAVLVLVVSLPLTVAAQRGTDLTAAALPGVLVWAAGLAFEAVGDLQLARFKADPAHRGQIMDRGLWAWTRHPNYFGDACVWWGLWLVALPAGGTWWTAAGPVVMTVLLTRVSGKDLLERGMARRPGWADYAARTSGFVPRPPRRTPDARGSNR